MRVRVRVGVGVRVKVRVRVRVRARVRVRVRVEVRGATASPAGGSAGKSPPRVWRRSKAVWLSSFSRSFCAAWAWTLYSTSAVAVHF